MLLSDPLPGTPRQIADAVRGLGLEGVVAKRRRSTYAAGRRSDAWVKVRFAQHQEFVIGGFKPNAATFDSLLVGYYDGRRSDVRRKGAKRLHAAPARAGVRADSRSRDCALPVREPAVDQDAGTGVKASPPTR